MARELPVLSEQVTESTEYKFFDWLQITMPLKLSDVRPIVLCSAKARFKMQPIVTMPLFHIELFLNALGRMPLEAEFDADTTSWQTLIDAEDYAGYLVEVQSRLNNLFKAGSDYPHDDKSDHQFLTEVYRTFYERSPLDEERSQWYSLLGIGIPIDREAVVATLKVSAEFTDRVLYTVTERQFESEINSLSEIVINEGRAMDNVDASIHNREEMYSARFSEEDRSLAPVRVIVGRAFFVGTEIFENDILMIGSAQINEISLSKISMTVLSDMSRQGIKVTKELTQRCSHIYKGTGCDTQDESPTCSRIKNDVTNGCMSKIPAPMLTGAGLDDNTPSFSGVVKGAPHPVEPVGIDPPGGGWGQGPCFLDGTEVTLEDSSKIPIEESFVGMRVQSPHWDGNRLITMIGTVSEVHEKFWHEYFELELPRKTTRVVPTHRYFSKMFKDYKPLNRIHYDDRIYRKQGVLWIPTQMIGRTLITKRVRVWNLTVTPWETYTADDCAVHNTKPIFYGPYQPYQDI